MEFSPLSRIFAPRISPAKTSATRKIVSRNVSEGKFAQSVGSQNAVANRGMADDGNADVADAETMAPTHKNIKSVTKNALAEFVKTPVFGGICGVGILSAMLAIAVQGDGLSQAQPFVWTEKSSSFQLPPSIRVFEGVAVADSGEPIRAWYADIDYNDLGLKVRPFLSQNARGREPVSQMARAQNTYVAINGGYFDMQSVPARTFSLVMLDNRVLVPNIARVTRSGRKYDVTRSAFGIRDDRTFDVAWVAQIADAKGKSSLFSYDSPTPNTKSVAAAPPSATFPANAKLWNVQHALGAGPTLISNGKIVDTFDNEVFFGSGFTGNDPYPRAAVGFTARNHLLLFATDGKQPEHSVGMSLARLSTELQSLGCVEAMNLDGGGSETLVINGAAINHPSDGRERNVSTMLAVSPSDSTVIAPQKLPTPRAVVPTIISPNVAPNPNSVTPNSVSPNAVSPVGKTPNANS